MLEVDGVTYYIWDFKEADIENKRSEIPDKKNDEKLNGIWMFTDEDADYKYTISFGDDGTFEQNAYDTEIIGTYSADGKKCRLVIVDLTGNAVDNEVEYAVDGDKLKFGNNEFVRTDSKYAFKSDIK